MFEGTRVNLHMSCKNTVLGPNETRSSLAASDSCDIALLEYFNHF